MGDIGYIKSSQFKICDYPDYKLTKSELGQIVTYQGKKYHLLQIYIKERHCLTQLALTVIGVAITIFTGFTALFFSKFRNYFFQNISNKLFVLKKSLLKNKTPNKLAFYWKNFLIDNEGLLQKQDWTKCVHYSERNKISSQLKTKYLSLKSIKPKSTYDHFFGDVKGLGGGFGLWMPGVALLASYLSEKKKIEGLRVCLDLELIPSLIQEINLNPNNQKYAFILGVNGFLPKANYPQHKVALCIEKKDGKLKFAVIDADAKANNNKINPNTLSKGLWEGYARPWDFNPQELVYRAVLKGCRAAQCKAEFFYSKVRRETTFGCAIFALQDAIAFLRDEAFFDKIRCNETIPIDDDFKIDGIYYLPPEFMVSTQSLKEIDKYKELGGEFNTRLIKRKQTLKQYLDAHCIDVESEVGLKKQNHYITKKHFRYLNLVFTALNRLPLEQREYFLNKTLVRHYSGLNLE